MAVGVCFKHRHRVLWIAHRSEELIKTVLTEEGYKGWIISDGYKVYRQFLKRLRCWAHLLRKARGLAESLDKPTQDFGKKTLDLLHALMDAVKEARKKPPDKALSEIYRELLDDYRRTCERVEASAPNCSVSITLSGPRQLSWPV